MKRFKATWIFFILVVSVVIYAYFFEYKKEIQEKKQESEEATIIPISLEEIVAFEIHNNYRKGENQKVRLVKENLSNSNSNSDSSNPTSSSVSSITSGSDDSNSSNNPNNLINSDSASNPGRENKKENKLDIKFSSWKIVSPIEDLGDSFSIESFLKNLTNAKRKSVIVDKNDDSRDSNNSKDDSKIDWALYGLEHPKGSIVVELNNGKSVEVIVANKNNFENNPYLRKKGTNQVLLAASSEWNDFINKEVKDFRDKSIFRLSSININNFSIYVRGKKEVFLVRKEGKWTYPDKEDKKENLIEDVVLDSKKIQKFLREIESLKAEDFVSEKKEDENAKIFYGLNDNSYYELKLSLTGGDELHFKVFKVKKIENDIKQIPGMPPQPGSSKDSVSFYATLSDKNTVFKLPNRKVKTLFNKNLNDFRDKNFPFNFDEKKVSQIIFRKDSLKEDKKNLMSLSLIKDKLNWISSEKNDSYEVDQTKVDIFLNKIKNLEALDFKLNNKNNLSKINQKNNISFFSENNKLLFNMAWGGKENYPQKNNDDDNDDNINDIKQQLKAVYVTTNLTSSVLLVKEEDLDPIINMEILEKKSNKSADKKKSNQSDQSNRLKKLNKSDKKDDN